MRISREMRDGLVIFFGSILVCLWVIGQPIRGEAGKLLGEESSYAREQGFEERYFYVASGNGINQIEYQAWAVPNAATSASVWRIRRFTYDSSNRISAIEYAGGDDAFNQVLDNRATLNY